MTTKNNRIIHILSTFILTFFLLTSCQNYTLPKNHPIKSTREPEVLYTEEECKDYFIVNKRTKKFHYKDCYHASQMNEENKIYFYGSFEKAEEMGYSHCYFCGE